MNLAAVATAAGVAFVLGRLAGRSEVVAARREASTDALTGLVNRAGLMHQLRNRAQRNMSYAIFLFDLNGFKPVNDTYGHRAGDELLAELGTRLGAEYGDHLVARLGGDEFVLVIDRAAQAQELMTVGERLLRVVECPVNLVGAGKAVSVSAAVGVTVAHRGESPGCALHVADQAMYRSKRLGRLCLQGIRVPQCAECRQGLWWTNHRDANHRVGQYVRVA